MRLFFGLLFALAASSAAAEGLSSKYSEMGLMTVSFEDQELKLTIPYDREEGFGFAEQKMIAGSFLTINTAAQQVNTEGEPSGTLVQVTLQGQGGRLELLSAELFDERGFDAPMAMGVDGGDGDLVSHTLEGDTLIAEVQGTFVRLTGYRTGEPKVDSGEAPLRAVINWEVDLPPIE